MQVSIRKADPEHPLSFVSIGRPYTNPCRIKSADTGCSLFLATPSLGPSYSQGTVRVHDAHLQDILVGRSFRIGGKAATLLYSRRQKLPSGLLHRKCKGRFPVVSYGSGAGGISDG